jgi:hypothetical protein
MSKSSESIPKVVDVIPTNRVKRLGNVKLDEQGRGTGAVQPTCSVPDVHKIIDVVHLETSTAIHSFGNDLRNPIDETQRSSDRKHD